MSNNLSVTPSALHASDDQGLICGFVFQTEQPPRALNSLLEAQELLAGRPSGFVWLHVNLSHASVETWLRRHADLGSEFFENLSNGSRSTRIERDGDALLGVINDLVFDFNYEASDVATLWMSVTEHLVVTARRHPLRSVDRLRHAVRRGEILVSSVALLHHLLRDQADELQRIVRKVADRLDDIEDEVLLGRHSRHSREMGRLRRMTVRLQRMLAPEPAAFARTLGQPPSWIRKDDLQDLNGANEEFAVTLRDIGSLQERIKLLQDEAAVRVAEENNASLFMLTMVTVLALPINLVAGLMGMNVGGVPFGENPSGFWFTLTFIAALTMGIAWIVVRVVRRKSD